MINNESCFELAPLMNTCYYDPQNTKLIGESSLLMNKEFVNLLKYHSTFSTPIKCSTSSQMVSELKQKMVSEFNERQRSYCQTCVGL